MEEFNEEQSFEENINEENPELKQILDSAALIIQAGILSKSEGTLILKQIKKRTAQLFPDRLETFNKIYEAHLKNLIEEFCIPEVE